MTFSKFNLLRRTSAAFAAAFFAFIAGEAQALTVTLSGVGQCTYTNMTVGLDGNVSVTCEASGPIPVSGNFSLTGPIGNVLIGATGVAATVSRTGGTAGAVSVGYAVSSITNSCAVPTGALNWADGEGGTKTIPLTIPSTPANIGQCTVAITVGAPGASGVTQVTFAVVVGGTTPTPGCPAIPTNAIAGSLPWGGGYLQARAASDQVMYYPLIHNPDTTKGSVKFMQGQQPVTPGLTVTEFSISKCPGVIDTTVAPQCYFKGPAGFVNNAEIFAYTRPVYGWDSQAKVSNRGCWAPLSDGPKYVNVRWQYPGLCPYSQGCGFTHQWGSGSW